MFLTDDRSGRISAERAECSPSLLDSSRWVISEPLFSDVLLRERRRAERSDLSMELLTVTFDGRSDHADAIWKAAVDAVNCAARETDIVGWMRTNAVLGIILSEVAADKDSADQVAQRIRRELVKRISAAKRDTFSVRVHKSPDVEAAANGSTLDEALIDISSDRRPRPTGYDVAKRSLDIVGSAALLAGLSPLMLLIAGLVKLKSEGPVLFKQVRVGQRGRPFEMLKFRTMHVNNDDRIHQAFVADLIKAATPANGVFKIVDDPRVTSIGRFLRKTSLDELPQLWNVVRGEMSLVGPRPPLPYEVKRYKPWHRRRILEAKPGITGLWQVKGRSRTTFDEMVRLDLRYARTRSLWMDIKILLATPGAVISGKGAA